jgi:hypothetical protein
MSAEQGNKLYRSIKWLWLLLQALILPLAALHAVSPAIRWPLAATPRIDGILPVLLLGLAGAVFLVFWLIAQALLAMARFPLSVKGGALLVGGTVAQFAFLVASGGSLAAAAYAVFFATLAALVMLTSIMAVMAACRRVGSPLARLAALLALLPAAGLVWFLATPLRPAFSGLPAWRAALEWLVLALNSGLIVFSLYRFSIFAPPPENDAAYTREWERWAAPTIIILILSATAAIALAGFARSR